MIFELKEIKSLIAGSKNPLFFPKIIYVSTTKFLKREVKKTYDLLEKRIKKRIQTEVKNDIRLTLIQDQIVPENELKFIENTDFFKAMVNLLNYSE